MSGWPSAEIVYDLCNCGVLCLGGQAAMMCYAAGSGCRHFTLVVWASSQTGLWCRWGCWGQTSSEPWAEGAAARLVLEDDTIGNSSTPGTDWLLSHSSGQSLQHWMRVRAYDMKHSLLTSTITRHCRCETEIRNAPGAPA